VITQLFGEPASGKSTLCVLAAVACLRRKKAVIFIDTEGFSIERSGWLPGLRQNPLPKISSCTNRTGSSSRETWLRMPDKYSAEKDGTRHVDSANSFYRTNLKAGRKPSSA
jgi:DNA repair protein RadB